ncbi:right-handed parallel beta-helix repeat-containing protein [Candidatus Bathyarchaeota archaeon]|nr:right-handed parallel beta-helix repeat-containing protein [Candidatus Bathyarchaeota archaeon]
MKNKKMEIAVFVTLLLLFSLLNMQPRPVLTESKTIIVPDDYATIQEAVNAAEAGDIIYVKTGVYHEHVTVEKNNLTLIGESAEETIIDGDGEGTVLYIKANYTTVKNFTIRKSGLRPDSALFLDHAYNSFVWGNILQSYYAGIRIYGSSQCEIVSNYVKNGSVGVWVEESSMIIIRGNNITENEDGIRIYGSEKCTVFGNNLDSNGMYGVEIYQSSHSILSGNSIINSAVGIRLYASSHNKIFHNNFINNTKQVGPIYQSFNNVWDDAYPSGGNYWSDYTGVDEKSGPYQNETGSDGIGDTPYIIDASNQDRYPLMTPYTPPVQNLNTGLHYPTIQDAIDASTTIGGHTILVRAGVYLKN